MNQEIKDITEGNKLIAPFDGWKLIPVSGTGLTPEHYERGEDWMDKAEDFDYHTNWNSLMPVVEKIEKLGYNTDIIFYQGDTMCLVSEGTPQGDGGKHVTYLVDETSNEKSKIEIVWQAVVQFIQWYNNTQNKSQ